MVKSYVDWAGSPMMALVFGLIFFFLIVGLWFVISNLKVQQNKRRKPSPKDLVDKHGNYIGPPQV
ncbi:MAG TPA: hypothetical protein VGO93_04975 [Candidatus Xenobia bacterium]|jgi:hypothetical protein